MGELARMNSQHANCTHPKRSVRRFGARRRQCGKCKCTWRIRQKKRGRKAKRASASFASAYLSGFRSTVRNMATQRKIGRSSVQRALARSIEKYTVQHGNDWFMRIPTDGDLVLIADAIWYRIKGMKYTIYVLLLRQKCGIDAVILPPTIFPGHEDIAGWLEAVSIIPKDMKIRIGAIVCDGGTGLVNLAYRNKWLLQRCQFHLLSAVQNYITTGPRSKNPAFAQTVLHLVQKVITETSQMCVLHALKELREIQMASRSKGVRRILGGLALHLNEYRTYIDYPQWNLPATSNTAESCIQCIRDLMYQCRGFRTKEKLELWLRAFVAHKKTIRCRSKSTELAG